MQDVAVELGGHPGRVVVRGFQRGHVLHEVGAEDEPAVVAHQLADVCEEGSALVRVQVADRAAEEGHEPPLWRRNVLEVLLEVAHHAVHREARIHLHELLRAALHHELGHVHRQVAVERARTRHRKQKRARLRRHSRAQLEQLRRAGDLDDLRRPPVEDRALAARGVVLGQRGDLVEELGAAVVVEVLGGQHLEAAAREPRAHVGGHRFERGPLEVAVDRDVGDAGHAAHRKPEKICRRTG